MVQRIDDPPLREWELNENHKRYDYPRATPSEDTLHIQFAILAAINAVVATACLIIVLSILRSPKVRSNPFNLYLLSIAAPDFLSSFFCLLTCALSAPKGSYYSEVMCGFQSFYLTWGFASNCWMNAVIVFQIHKLLRYSHVRRRYSPPTRRTVALHAAIVYLYAAFWGFIGVWNIQGLPHKTYAYYGFACFSMEYDQASTLFWWLLFVPCFLGLPVVYFTYVIYDIWKRDLLPPMGRRRNLSLYFFRLVFVYFCMWLPFAAVCTVGNFVHISSWIFWAGSAWSHLQGLASSLVSMTKPDIKEAVVSLLCCRFPEEGETELEGLPSSENRSSSENRRSSIRISLMKSLRFGSDFSIRRQSSVREEAKMARRSSTPSGLSASMVREHEHDGSNVAGNFVSEESASPPNKGDDGVESKNDADVASLAISFALDDENFAVDDESQDEDGTSSATST
jgi:hypothetical protein